MRMAEKWQIENIPDSDRLYFRIHKQNVFDSKDFINIIRPRAFYNTPASGGNMSTDWNKYATPQQTLDHVSKQYKTGKTEFKNKDDFGVVSFSVDKIKEIDINHFVLHDPIENIPEIIGNPNNRAHAIVDGKISGDKEDSLEVRALFAEIANWEILPKR